MRSIYIKSLLILFQCIFISYARAGSSEIIQIMKKLEHYHKRDTLYVDLKVDLAYHYSEISPSESRKYIEEVAQLAEQLDYAKGRIRIGYVLTKTNTVEGKYADALNEGYKALKLSRDIQNKELEALLLNCIGITYWYMKKPEKSKVYILRAEEIALATKNYDVLGMVYSNMGLFYKSMPAEETMEY